MKQILFIVALIYAVLSLSACKSSEIKNSKKHIFYYNTDSEEVTKEKYDSLIDYSYNIDYYTTTDTSISARLVDRLRIGQMDTAQFRRFKRKLHVALGIKIDFATPIHIRYFINPDRSSSSEILDFLYKNTHSLYLQDKYPGITNYYISHYTIDQDYPETEVLRDKSGFLQETFFHYLVRPTYYLAIRPDGSYISCIGDGCELHEMVISGE